VGLKTSLFLLPENWDAPSNDDKTEYFVKMLHDEFRFNKVTCIGIIVNASAKEPSSTSCLPAP
jgi:hypothetical protein